MSYVFSNNSYMVVLEMLLPIQMGLRSAAVFKSCGFVHVVSPSVFYMSKPFNLLKTVFN